MIFLQVDEAFAFDYLAILEIKNRNGLDCSNEIRDVTDLLRVQLKDNLEKVIESGHYAELINANERVFKMVELAKNNSCSAMQVDQCNHDRFLAKCRLQKHFFGKMKEKKSERTY